MTTTNLAETYASYSYLRSVCKHFEERLMLGEAIRNGWPAEAIEAEARSMKSRSRALRHTRHLMAIHHASKQRYVSPEERKAVFAEFHAAQAARKARDAIKATKATRPVVPPDFKAIRAACRSMLDCDHLIAAIEAGWNAPQINCLAQQFSQTASRVPYRETPAALRFALGFINGKPPDALSGWLPPELQPASSQLQTS